MQLLLYVLSVLVYSPASGTNGLQPLEPSAPARTSCSLTAAPCAKASRANGKLLNQFCVKIHIYLLLIKSPLRKEPRCLAAHYSAACAGRAAASASTACLSLPRYSSGFPSPSLRFIAFISASSKRWYANLSTPVAVASIPFISLSRRTSTFLSGAYLLPKS